MTFQLPAVENKSACKFRKKSTLLLCSTVANVRPATQQKLAIGASFVRLEPFKKGESFAPGGGH